jgi:hypothetical protein
MRHQSPSHFHQFKTHPTARLLLQNKLYKWGKTEHILVTSPSSRGPHSRDSTTVRGLSVPRENYPTARNNRSGGNGSM